MRSAAAALGLLAVIATSGEAQVPNDSSSVRPDAVVQIQSAGGNAEMVKISVRDANYPPKLLVSQATALGKELGGASRGIQVSSATINDSDPHSQILHVVFAVDGLIDHAKRLLRVGPIIKAMAGAPAPYTISGIYIDFDREQIGPDTLDSFISNSVRVARRSTNPSVEYAVQVLNQDPAQIDVPDSATLSQAKPAPKATPGIDWVVYVVYGIGAVLAGALVYCLLLLRPSQRPKSRA